MRVGWKAAMTEERRILEFDVVTAELAAELARCDILIGIHHQNYSLAVRSPDAELLEQVIFEQLPGSGPQVVNLNISKLLLIIRCEPLRLVPTNCINRDYPSAMSVAAFHNIAQESAEFPRVR
jgi:hypothetical protein